nr:transposon Pol polyprotein [Lupinus angustifolius]
MMVHTNAELRIKEQSHISLMASHNSNDEYEENLRPACNLWYLDSSCSKHMTSDKSKFSVLTLRDKGYVTYGDNNKGRILGVVRIEKPPSTTIYGVLYVEGLNHNLLSISQLCDKGFHVAFYLDKCIIESKDSNNSKLIERKNQSLEELTRTMLNETNLPKYFRADAVSTACYVSNRVLIRPILKKTPYELFKGRKRNISHLHVFGCKCFILNNGKDNLGKFDAKADEGIFLSYSLTSKAYRVFNKRTLVVEESVHVTFDETNHVLKDVISCDEDDLPSSPTKNNSIVDITTEPEELRINDNLSSQEEHIYSDLPKEWRTHRNYPIDNIISDINKGITTRRMRDACLNMTFVSQIEPSKIDDAIEDEHWILAMQE